MWVLGCVEDYFPVCLVADSVRSHYKQRSTMVDLPPELYRPIVEHVQSMRDLCALGLVCRDLQYEAERLIYRNIPDYPPKSLLVTLVSNPRLHPHVWRLGYFHFQRRRVGKFFVLNLLRPLCNLVSLTIEHASVLEAAGACNFRLKSLQLDYPWDRHVANFVESQPDLEELNAGTSESGSDFVWPIQSSSLPNLSIVTAPLALLFHLVPHRPVVHIRALRDGRFGPQFHSLAESLALSIGPVRTFRYDHLDPTKLNYLAYHLPDLRYVGVAEFDDSFTVGLPFVLDLFHPANLGCL